MLIIAAKNDERVPPFHSYKFAAKLQNRETQKNPILLRVKSKSGHYSTDNFISSIREKAHIYGFILYHLNQN
jgi:prolyl oligopeptidase